MKKTKRLFYFIQTILFIGLIFTPIIISALFPRDFQMVSKSENRRLAARPVFDINLLDPYPKRFESFYNDHFIYRSQLLSYHSFINYFFFHQSPNPDMVVVGRDGWLFYSSRERNVYEGNKTLKPYEVQSIVEELHRRTIIFMPPLLHFFCVVSGTELPGILSYGD